MKTKVDEAELTAECEKIIDNNIYGDMTSIVTYILNKSYDDSKAPISIDYLEHKPFINPEEEEAFEWDWSEIYSVSRWLADKLYSKNELVIRGENNFWFRYDAGRALIREPAIRFIAMDTLRRRKVVDRAWVR